MKNASKGFTLLEIMVSISIIAIVFLSLFKMQAGNITLSEAEQFYSAAPYLAQKIIAHIETDFTDTSDTSDTSDASGEFEDDFKNYRWSYSITSEYEPLDSDVMNGEKIENFKKIDLEISKNHDYSITFQTWRYVQR
ncbi:MAG: prepilin-type N-terminal cleavage/methylation domain-containing protein [Thermodesulfobacteriota bacterium]|nr:prepilin-type N-terminal cleavage/methylation domain-containing protein [Thermodesulfobacteriota bacterium]